MSCKTIVTLLLLSCLGATGTPLGLTEEPPLEGGFKKLPPVEHLTITGVRWFKNEASTNVQVCVEEDVRCLKKEASTNVQICVEEELPPGTPGFSYTDEVNADINAEGVIDDMGCATFPIVALPKFTESLARYQLTVVDSDKPAGFLGGGVSTFAITVKSTLLTCGDSLITKVTWSGTEELPGDLQCIKSSSKLGKACYNDGDITKTDLCFVVTDEKGMHVNVCLNGLVDPSPNSIGPISSNYFFYGLKAVSNAPADATLSLTMSIRRLAHMRAIVRKAEDPSSPKATPFAHVYDCSTTDCTFPKYERKLATYEVCLDAMDARLATLKTATTTFTDLNLYAFDGGFQKSMLLECVFANGLTDFMYTANLLDKLPEGDSDDVPRDTSHIDCTGVTPTHACFGYLDADLDSGTAVYVTVSDTDGLNTIIVPFTIPAIPDLRRE